MSLDKIRHHCAYIASRADSIESAALTQAYAGAAATVSRELRVAPGLLAALELDLVYCLLRHQHWARAPLFEDIAVDFVITEYQLDRDTAAWLTMPLCATLRFLAGERSDGAPVTNADFLRYIVVACATAASERELEIDLGIGRPLLGRVREAVAALVMPGTRSPDVVAYLPELEAEISTITCELARELQSTPWALQIHRLRYHLSGIAAPWHQIVATHGARWLFELLLAIGVRQGMTVGQIEQRLRRALPPEPAGGTAAELLAALHLAGLAFPYSDGGAARSGGKWQLTPFAQELTADAFARNQHNTSRDPLATLGELNPQYQAGVIRALEDPSAELLRSVATSRRPLAPAGLRETLVRLAQIAGVDDAVATAERLVTAEASPWLRKAACEALSEFAPAKDIGQILANVLKSDPSPAVRAAALQATMRPRATSAVEAASRGSESGPEAGAAVRL